MRSLTATEAQDWCSRHGIALDSRSRPARPRQAVSTAIPSDSGARVALVGQQFVALEGETEVLVWFTEWGVWPSGERPHIFDRFRAAYGETRPLIDVPAFVFSSGEAQDALSFVTLGVLFLWDVNVLGATGQRYLLYSHDEMVDVLV
ncbi:MAG: hypothetical protein P4L93_01790 [Coriobacteriia bacterium]|nr:hypothetical protein [Coriobacteriia bacterium]